MLTKYESAKVRRRHRYFPAAVRSGRRRAKAEHGRRELSENPGNSRFVDPKCGTIGGHTGRQEALFYEKATEGKTKETKTADRRREEPPMKYG